MHQQSAPGDRPSIDPPQNKPADQWPKSKEVENIGTDSMTDEEGGELKMTWRTWLAMLSFQLGYMSDVFVLSMASSVLGEINRDIGPSDSYAWMAAAQTLGAAVMSPSVGRLSDIFGRRNFLLIGNVIGAVGCAVAATAKNVNTVIGASVIIGIGSAMHQLAWSCLAELVPKNKRSLALGVFQTTLTPSSVFAPVVAYSFVINTSVGWRGAYWLPFALDITALVLVFFFYKPLNQYIRIPGKTQMQQFLGLDWVGNFLLVAGLVLLLVGISLGGHTFPWKSAGAIAPIIVGVFLLISLGLWESYADLESPIFPRAIFANVRGFTVIIGGVFLLGMAFYSSAVLWPQQVSMLYTTNLIHVGWYCSTVGIAGAIAGPIAGWIFAKAPSSRLVLTGTVLMMAVASGAQAIVTPDSNIASTAITALIGASVAGATVVSTTMIQLGVSHEFIGIATGLAITMRSVGGSIGTVIYSSVLSSRFQDYLASDVANPLAQAGVSPEEIPAIIQAMLAGATEMLSNLSPEILTIAADGIKEAFAGALRTVYLVSIAFGVLGVVCVSFSADVKHLETNKIDIHLVGEKPSEEGERQV